MDVDPDMYGADSGAPAPHSSFGSATGRWTTDEHSAFVRALRLHGRDWKSIASAVPSRTVVQIRTHAQKYFQKLHKSGLVLGDAGEAPRGTGHINAGVPLDAPPRAVRRARLESESSSSLRRPSRHASFADSSVGGSDVDMEGRAVARGASLTSGSGGEEDDSHAGSVDDSGVLDVRPPCSMRAFIVSCDGSVLRLRLQPLSSSISSPTPAAAARASFSGRVGAAEVDSPASRAMHSVAGYSTASPRLLAAAREGRPHLRDVPDCDSLADLDAMERLGISSSAEGTPRAAEGERGGYVPPLRTSSFNSTGKRTAQGTMAPKSPYAQAAAGQGHSVDAFRSSPGRRAMPVVNGGAMQGSFAALTGSGYSAVSAPVGGRGLVDTRGGSGTTLAMLSSTIAHAYPGAPAVYGRPDPPVAAEDAQHASVVSSAAVALGRSPAHRAPRLRSSSMGLTFNRPTLQALYDSDDDDDGGMPVHVHAMLSSASAPVGDNITFLSHSHFGSADNLADLVVGVNSTYMNDIVNRDARTSSGAAEMDALSRAVAATRATQAASAAPTIYDSTMSYTAQQAAAALAPPAAPVAALLQALISSCAPSTSVTSTSTSAPPPAHRAVSLPSMPSHALTAALMGALHAPQLPTAAAHGVSLSSMTTAGASVASMPWSAASAHALARDMSITSEDGVADLITSPQWRTAAPRTRAATDSSVGDIDKQGVSPVSAWADAVIPTAMWAQAATGGATRESHELHMEDM